MGEALKAFLQGLRETPRAFFAPVLSAMGSVRKVFEAEDLREHKNSKKHPVPN